MSNTEIFLIYWGVSALIWFVIAGAYAEKNRDKIERGDIGGIFILGLISPISLPIFICFATGAVIGEKLKK